MASSWAENEKWVNAQFEQLITNTEKAEQQAHKLEELVGELSRDIAGIKVKMAIIGALAGMIGSSLVGIFFAYIQRK